MAESSSNCDLDDNNNANMNGNDDDTTSVRSLVNKGDGEPQHHNITEVINEQIICADADDLNDKNNTQSQKLLTNGEDTVLYPDNSGVDTEDFIKKTLLQNPKDRLFMLFVEKQLVNFLSDDK